MSDRPSSPLGGTDRFVADLEVWVACSVADQTRDGRRRERSLRAQAEEESTVAGVLVDLAEHRRQVVVATRARRHHRARVRLVGRDFVLLAPERSTVLLVRVDAVTAIRTLAHAAPVPGDRSPRLDVGLHDALAVLAVDRPRISLTTEGGETWGGELRRVGHDLVVVRLEGEGGVAYVPIRAIDEVALEDLTAGEALG